jgi:hypothetical protein
MIDQTNEKQIEKINPKEELEALTDAIIGGGILLIISAVLGYLVKLLNDPIYILISSIWDILVKMGGESMAISLLLAIILFIAAGIAKIGTFLKDEEEQELYRLFIYLFWVLGLIIFFLLGMGYTLKLVSKEIVISAGFITIIAPLIAFAILKGFRFLLLRFLR